ncbi:MAG: hypothetical protein AAFY60_06735, partial [Myxococcota bacterium]
LSGWSPNDFSELARLMNVLEAEQFAIVYRGVEFDFEVNQKSEVLLRSIGRVTIQERSERYHDAEPAMRGMLFFDALHDAAQYDDPNEHARILEGLNWWFTLRPEDAMAIRNAPSSVSFFVEDWLDAASDPNGNVMPVFLDGPGRELSVAVIDGRVQALEIW